MEKKKRFKMPHAYVIIFIMTVITAILANIIPAGTFDRVEDASGNSVVVADSFHHVDKIGCSIFDMFKSFQIGFEDSAQIIFFIIFAYAFVYVLLKNGTFDALVGSVLRKVGNRIELIIPVCMILFGLLGSTMGMFEETYGLIPVFISIAMHSDTMPSSAAVSFTSVSQSDLPLQPSTHLLLVSPRKLQA